MRQAFAIILLSFGLQTGAFAAVSSPEAELRHKFSAIALSYALDQICDFTDNSEKVDFLAEYIDAKWWLWRARTGVGKNLAKKMTEKAWVISNGGAACDDELNKKFRSGVELLSSFAGDAEALFGTPSPSLLNPKPNQKHIFAIYQLARQSWVIGKRCGEDRDVLRARFAKLMTARTALLSVFRPKQLGGLKKATAEMKTMGTVGACSEKRRAFSVQIDELLNPLTTIDGVAAFVEAGKTLTQSKQDGEQNEKL